MELKLSHLSDELLMRMFWFVGEDLKALAALRLINKRFMRVAHEAICSNLRRFGEEDPRLLFNVEWLKRVPTWPIFTKPEIKQLLRALNTALKETKPCAPILLIKRAQVAAQINKKISSTPKHQLLCPQVEGCRPDTFLHKAAENNCVDAIKFLLDAGANHETKGYLERSPLHWAAKYNCVDAIKLLLSRGADLHAKDHCNNTPLHLAAKHNGVDAIQSLLDAKADFNAKNYYKQTPLDLAIDQDAAVKILVKAGAHKSWVEVEHTTYTVTCLCM